MLLAQLRLMMRGRKFSLPGKKALLKSDNEFEIILVDAADNGVNLRI